MAGVAAICAPCGAQMMSVGGDAPAESRPAAVVTGATSGIGRAYAARLATAGYEVLLCGRREEALRAVSASLANGPHPLLVGDLADRATRDALRRAVEGRRGRLGYVVANAGFGSRVPFLDRASGEIESMSAVHGTAVADLAAAALPALFDVSPRGDAAVRMPLPPAFVVVASMAAFMPAPRAALYTATKAFNVALVRALQPAAASAGVRVQALCPGYTHTEFHDRIGWEAERTQSHGLVRWMSADAVVDASIRAARHRSPWGSPVVVPGWTNRLLLALVSLMPRRVYGRVVTRVGP